VAKTVVKTVAKTVSKTDAKNSAKPVVTKEPKNTVKTVAKTVSKTDAKNLAKPVVTKEPKNTVKTVARNRVEDDAEKTVTKNTEMDAAADPVDEGLKLIQSKPEGILQSELWKELGVDSRKCSRIVKKLEDCGFIDRVEFKKDGIKTYLLRAKQQPVDPGHLLAGDELIPCVGCELECVVEECHPLMDWMYQLAIVQHTEE
jgi:Lrp/AsnC family leucine-responsive transcriptional regulator